MKRVMPVLFAMAVMFGLVCSVSAQTAKSAPAKAETSLNEEDRQMLRDATQLLRDYFDEKKQKEMTESKGSKKKQEAKEEAKQTDMADVADKALGLLEKYIGKAEQAFKSVAPEVWRVMIKQQYANAVSGVLMPSALIMLLAIYVLVIKTLWKELPKADTDYDTNWWARFWLIRMLPFVLFIILGIFFSFDLASSIKMLINPEYYAFRDLLQIVLNRGGM